MNIMRAIRDFPYEGFIFLLIALGVLSWTDEVQFFRLHVAQHYEHMVAYGLVAVVLFAAKGRARLNIVEISIVVGSASFLEAIKVFVSFRHPKTSDFIADVIGFGFALACVYICSGVISIAASAIRRLRKPSERQIAYSMNV